MNKVLLNGDEFECGENNLPLLIHGEDKAGASLFTITFAVNLFASGSKLLFLTGYEMAREEFLKQTTSTHKGDDAVIFFLKDEVEEFARYMTTLPDINDRVIVIKNIDLFDEKTFDLIGNKQKIIISGDINKCPYKNKIQQMNFVTKVLFSKLEDNEIPELQKYQGFLTQNHTSGISTIQIAE
ncbi:MAG: hypothetical protein KBC06_01950 [Candidatus Pacebacteria bacterium]|nr:hypothetical protein [Candidatus Paceibacterota bacterium]